MKDNIIINEINDKVNYHSNFEEIKDKINININNKQNKTILKSKPFKLSIALTILLLIISMTIIGVNYINKPKYQEYHFTEEEIGSLPFLGMTNMNGWIDRDSCFLRDFFIEPCCSLLQGRISNQYYIVGYLGKKEQGPYNNPFEKYEATTWYIFTEKTAPYEIEGKVSWLVIKYLEITYNEDISTGYVFENEIVEKNYLYCKYEIDVQKNEIHYQEKEYKCSQINDEFLRRHLCEKIYTEDDVRYVNGYINILANPITRYINFIGDTEDTRFYINYLFYNLITINDKTYMQVDLYEINNGEKQELDYIKKWGEFGEQLTKIKEGEIVSEDGKYIMGLYPLEEVVKLVQNIK